MHQRRRQRRQRAMHQPRLGRAGPQAYQRPAVDRRPQHHQRDRQHAQRAEIQPQLQHKRMRLVGILVEAMHQRRIDQAAPEHRVMIVVKLIEPDAKRVQAQQLQRLAPEHQARAGAGPRQPAAQGQHQRRNAAQQRAAEQQPRQHPGAEAPPQPGQPQHHRRRRRAQPRPARKRHQHPAQAQQRNGRVQQRPARPRAPLDQQQRHRQRPHPAKKQAQVVRVGVHRGRARHAVQHVAAEVERDQAPKQLRREQRPGKLGQRQQAHHRAAGHKRQQKRAQRARGRSPGRDLPPGQAVQQRHKQQWLGNKPAERPQRILLRHRLRRGMENAKHTRRQQQQLGRVAAHKPAHAPQPAGAQRPYRAGKQGYAGRRAAQKQRQLVRRHRVRQQARQPQLHQKQRHRERNKHKRQIDAPQGQQPEQQHAKHVERRNGAEIAEHQPQRQPENLRHINPSPGDWARRMLACGRQPARIRRCHRYSSPPPTSPELASAIPSVALMAVILPSISLHSLAPLPRAEEKYHQCRAAPLLNAAQLPPTRRLPRRVACAGRRESLSKLLGKHCAAPTKWAGCSRAPGPISGD